MKRAFTIYYDDSEWNPEDEAMIYKYETGKYFDGESAPVRASILMDCYEHFMKAYNNGDPLSLEKLGGEYKVAATIEEEENSLMTSDEIKQHLDIVEVVSSYVPTLQRAGRNYKSPCPFHIGTQSERTPSFVVFPERQSWRCFGACATGGDVLSFVMRTEKMNFADTMKLLGDRIWKTSRNTRRS